MATYSMETLQGIVDDYTRGQDFLSEIEIDIVPEENKIDPLEALKMYQGERSTENGLRLATLFCVNKRVAFSTKAGDIILDFTPAPGKPIQQYMEDHPYLLDILCSASWGILLKKLTPPSIGSAKVGG